MLMFWVSISYFALKMTRVQIYLIFAVVLALLSTSLGMPIFWLLPWNSWLNPTTTSSSAGSSGTSSTSSATTRTPSNVSIAIGDRTNTNAGVDDYGTVIDGLTITAGRRKRSAEHPEDPGLPSNESYIQIGNHVIRLPSRVISNVTINVVDGVPYVGTGGAPTAVQEVPQNLFDHIKNFFDGVFNRTN